MTAALLMLAALSIEAAFGWPNWLHRIVRHPVVWMGSLISLLERALNRQTHSDLRAYAMGTLTALITVLGTTLIAYLISNGLPDSPPGYVAEAVIASSLIAARSLYTHVAAVGRPLDAAELEGARNAVSHIVGRDPALLDSPAIARASLESLAENASDGVVAPLFWGAIFGLPGLAAYKAINTLDSMIGHKTARYRAFGRFSARLDDAANLIPARLTAALFILASGRFSAISIIMSDARQHRSPNAGWPEAALAGSLGVRLSGPRSYHGRSSNEPWLNQQCPDPDAATLHRGLNLYLRAMGLAALCLAAVSVLSVMP